MVFTEKQQALLKIFKENRLRRINILSGSVRSGKTWISLVLWAFWVLTMPKDRTYFMAAKTLTSLKRNCLDLLTTLVGEGNFTYSLSLKEGYLFGRKVILEGASDVRSEGKIRGLTLQGAYVDELTLFPEDFFVMLLSRLSESGAKLFATTNPDNPQHFVKQKYLDRKDELDLCVFEFFVDDNTFLPKEYVEGLKKEYTGVFYERFILGKWVAAEGVIYRQIADNTEKYVAKSPGDIAFATIGVDFGGNKSATAFSLVGFSKDLKQVVVLDEFYLKDKISPAELEAHFVAFVKKNQKQYPIFDAFCDSAETTLIRGLENAAYKAGLGICIKNAAKGPIIDRIRLVNSLLSHNRFFLLPHCQKTIDALCGALWDAESLEDRRLDDGTLNVDSLDALEYALEYYKNDLIDMG